ncbi:ARM repeat-containing protein [Pleurotus eryngii]|uniref:ARM repeat-containing protein n=1 Tax=Pleurotus eryngii TaxID=5323 RepID=A0A9P6DFK4_PLEER|nr:ARM repeat-containing protein [Pleurotus eryngii]
MSRLPPSLSRTTVQSVSPTELLDVVSGAASQDPSRVTSSSTRLKELLEVFGAFDLLHEIAAQRDLPLAVRQQAIIQFKNRALNHWRSRKLLSDEQRVRIRARCLTFLDERDDVIAQCNEVIVAKIARIDYANNWANLVSDLMANVDSNLQKRYSSSTEDPYTTLILRRSLDLLNAIIKELSIAKMLNGIKVMFKIVDDLRSVFQGYYSQICPNFSNVSMTAQELSSDKIYTDLVLGHLCFKSLVKMSIWAWQRIDPSGENVGWLAELFSSAALQLRTLFEIRKNVLQSVHPSAITSDANLNKSVDILTRHIRLFGKFFRLLQQLSASRFVDQPMCTDLILYYWSQTIESSNRSPDAIADSNTALFPVRFLVQSMVLFKEYLIQWRRNSQANKGSLSQDFIENAVRILVTRFIPLHSSDLERWVEDPEEWVSEESKDNDQWEYEIRACSERLLMTLSSQYPAIVIPLLKTTFDQMAAQPPTDLQGIIQKEALYCAFGRCASRLKDSIPFDDWLQNTLLAEASEINPIYPIIKRRIAWLIGKWVHDSCTSPNNPIIWRILIHLLQDRGPGTDAVVRLTAAIALGECVDTLDFKVEAFTSYLPTAVSELVKLLSEAETADTKRQIAKSLNIVIQQSGTEVFQHAIAAKARPLRTSVGDDWLFKSTLLGTVTNLLGAIKEQSTLLSAIVVPLLQESLSPGALANLDEDALVLWLAALRNTTSIHGMNGAPGLLDLFPIAMSMLASNFDLLGSVVEIATSYLFLDARTILATYGTDLFRAFLQGLTSGAVGQNLKQMIISLEFLVQLTPASVWAEPMHTSGLFAHLITKVTDDDAGSIFLTELIYLFARMVMADRPIFVQLMSATTSLQNTTETKLYEGLLDQWWSKFDAMSEARHRKLTAMGIASLVATGRPEVLQRLSGEIFNIWLDVFGEIKEIEAEAANDAPDSNELLSPLNLKRYWELDEAPAEYYSDSEDTPEYNRRKALYDQDPVRTMKLNVYVAGHLRDVEQAIGSKAFQSMYLSKADPTVVKQITDELARA